MGVSGYAQGGASGFGPSTVFSLLPWANYRSIGTWFEEWIDSLGNEMDVLWSQFVTAAARTNLLNPSYTPSSQAAPYLGNTTTAPTTLARGADTMLDLLCAIAGIPTPIDTNLTVAMKQGLAVAAQKAFKRKSVRRYILSLAAQMTDGVAASWSLPPNQASIIFPDGAPSPGYGIWVQSTNSLATVIRPWVLATARSIAGRIFPAWGELGVGYSQFRASYSAAGEPVLPTGVHINLLANEHFSTWSLGVPTSWTKTGVATLTQGSSGSINWEFTTNNAVLDLSAATIGQTVGLSQSTSLVNNQLTHRFQLDYQYTNAQNVGVLQVQITDTNRNGTTYYWNATTQAWTTTVTSNIAPPSSTRARYAFDVVTQAASSSSSITGSSTMTVSVFARHDGTSTTATTYTLYRAALYEKYSLTIEEAATGERTAWHPLIDSPGWTTASRTAGTDVLLEMASADRSAYKLVQSSTGVAFPYHAALSGRGYQSNSAWTNVVKGSNDFGADWTLSNATRTANDQISPIVGETSPTAVKLTATSVAAQISQVLGAGINPQSKTYAGGVWVKKLTSDASHVLVQLVSNNTTTVDYTLTQSQGWKLLPIRAGFGAGDTTNLSMVIKWASASATAAIAVASAYVYDITGKTKVLYPPVIQTPIGSTSTLNATTCQAVTQTTNTNVLHPLLQRSLQSVVRGTLALTIVPMFDASSQPSGQVIFDLSQGAAQNRLVLRVNSGALELRRWDNAGNQWVASITLSASLTPSAGSMTWLRDTAIDIRASWSDAQTQLSAGNGNASGTKPGSWAPSDASVSKLLIGSDTSGTNQFDGLIRNVECIQVGAPVT